MNNLIIFVSFCFSLYTYNINHHALFIKKRVGHITGACTVYIDKSSSCNSNQIGISDQLIVLFHHNHITVPRSSFFIFGKNMLYSILCQHNGFTTLHCLSHACPLYPYIIHCNLIPFSSALVIAVTSAQQR